MTKKVRIQIYADPNNPRPTRVISDVPWFSGITALQAMIIGGTMSAADFSFRVIYRSGPICGAEIDAIDGVSDGDTAKHYWLLYVDGCESKVGASEAIILGDATDQTPVVEWRYTDVSAVLKPVAARRPWKVDPGIIA